MDAAKRTIQTRRFYHGLQHQNNPSPSFRAGFVDEDANRQKFPRNEDGTSTAYLFHIQDRIKGFAYVLDCIKKVHAPVVDLFDTGVGYHLQFLESQVLANVLVMIAKSGPVALPLNDGVVVSEKDVDF